ncbi:NAD(P)H-binding protein [Nocardiopsis rhodophaea]|uniref:NAD(P)H-binding protein n=1 Tax=Nocardiopsis rhodophaea TaxID=280238 RepID=A0ABP5EYS6_9ACTN
MTVLVTGATGNIGRHVVQGLVDRGVNVRALTRDPRKAQMPEGVEVAQGDLARPDTLAPALEGATRMFLFPQAYRVPVPERLADYASSAGAVEAAEKAGVRRLVVMSPEGGLVEAVQTTAMEWTIVNPGEFMLNKLDYWGPTIRTEGAARSAYPDSPGCPIHEADIADVIVAVLLDDGHAGATYELTGPELLTPAEQVRAIGQGIGRELRFQALSPEEGRAELVKHWGALSADHFIEYQQEWATTPPTVLPTVEQITGHPARTLRAWAADHAASFR